MAVRSGGFMALALVTAGVVLAAGTVRPVAAQVNVSALSGEWIRLDSNHEPNDRMKILIGQDVGTITRAPAEGTRSFTVGKQLWRAIRGTGTVQVLGSDGNYYPGTFTLEGDVLRLRVDHGGAGNTQVWGRAGTIVEGDWVRVAMGVLPGDRMRIVADGAQATIRFLPANAPLNLRIGSQFWRDIRGTAGSLEFLGSDGRYRTATLRIERGGEQLRVGADGPSGGDIWVRPSDVEATLAALAAGNSGGGADATGGQPAGPPACAASSLPAGTTGLTWGWTLSNPNALTNAFQASTTWSNGISEYMGQAPGPGVVVTDIEYSRLPGIVPEFAWVWQRPSGSEKTQHRTGMTLAEFGAENQAKRRAGYRALDVEAYPASGGTRYAAVWVSNPEGMDWEVDAGVSGTEYGQRFTERHRDGFRLVDVEAWRTPQGVRYAGIWLRSCDNTNWQQRRDMGRLRYDHVADSLAALGFRVVDFESYRTDGGQLYAAIWEKVSGRLGRVYTDRTLTQFLNRHREATDEGFRLVDYESYETADGIRYAGVWTENDARYRYALRKPADTAITDYRKKHRIPGISVAIIRNGDLIYSRGFGWADSARGKEAYSGTVYFLASISKVVGGTLAARLEAKGAIDLTRRTSSYVDGLPSHHTHTLEQLLAKTGCVWHYSEGPEPPQKRYDEQRDVLRSGTTAPAAVLMAAPGIPRWWHYPLLGNCTPGQRYHYTTHGYTFLGAALEQATGKSLARLIRDEIAVPARAPTLRPTQATKEKNSHRDNPFMAEPYAVKRSTRRSELTKYEDASWKLLGGGLESSAPDLARFGWATLNGTLVSTAVRDGRLWNSLTGGLRIWDTTATAPAVGLAWNLVGTPVSRAQHGGVATAARSELRIYLNRGVVIAILTNQRESAIDPDFDDHPLHSLAQDLAKIVQDHPP